MFREDILFSCGFTKERLLEASDLTVDALRYMMELAFSQEDRIHALRYLLRINCYLAARCCITQEDRDYVFSMYSVSNHDSAESLSLAPHHRVLALYYLEKYDTARSLIDLCFAKQPDVYKKGFYKRIMKIGFYRSKDLVYFLCHCHNGSYFFDTLLELVAAYNWKCTISTEERYYPDFVQMITDLINGRYYTLLYKLLFVIGENVEQAKQIILQTQGWTKNMQLVAHFQQNSAGTVAHDVYSVRLDSRLYAQIRLILEFAQGNAKAVFYRKRVCNIQRICRQSPPQNAQQQRAVSLSLFLLCAQQYCNCGVFTAFEEVQHRYLDPQYLLEDDFLRTYLLKLIQIQTHAVKNMHVDILEKIDFFNIFSPRFKCSAWNESKKQQAVQFLQQDIYTDQFCQNACSLVDVLQDKQDVLARIYPLTYLRELFPEMKFTGNDSDANKKQNPGSDKQVKRSLTLIYGRTNNFSFRFRCEGDDYIGYRIPPATYQILWCSEFRRSMIEVYNGEPEDGMEVSLDEYPVNVYTLKSATLVVKPGQYITLSKGSHCILHVLEDFV